ncbi:GNAT family N-acetyltransferase [Alicyclobacillus curvatus]|nr:GNAT family N-acetyltransferase [Alicyclobacillus curvatus]
MFGQSQLPVVVLKPMTLQDARSIWRAGRGDPAWPETSRTLRGFRTMVTDWQAAEVIGWGALRAVHLYPPASSPVIGFVTFEEVGESWTGPSHKAVECGTYVVPAYRGLGLNRRIKAASVSLGFTALGADSILYAVPLVNQVAMRSLQRIVGDNTDKVLAETRFQKWLRYRQWKEGTSFQLFVISLESAKACHLLDPDGYDGHLIRE